MQNAICYAYQDPSKDISKKAMQAKISSKGEIPSVEEVLQFAVTQVREKNRWLKRKYITNTIPLYKEAYYKNKSYVRVILGKILF